MDRKASRRYVGGRIAREKESGDNESGENKKESGEKEIASGGAAERGAGAHVASTGDACPQAWAGSDTAVAAVAAVAPVAPVAAVAPVAPVAPVAASPLDVALTPNDDRLRRRGCDEDDRRHGCNDLAFRALCGMGFRAHEARRALGTVGQRRAGSPPAAIETLLREALAVLAP
jgi:hypothetical protein